MIIRAALTSDAAAIAGIYAHHVLHGTATFDTVPPGVPVWLAKIEAIGSRGWPFLVAEWNGALSGYAYATQFRDRAAYAHTAENSIYVAPEMTGRGVGTSLMNALLVSAAQSGFREIIAVIGGGAAASVALHARCGFVYAGRMRNVGHKFGQMLDTVYMQHSLRPADPDAVRAPLTNQP
jgi:L-amino acid N-acyltransferase YncA